MIVMMTEQSVFRFLQSLFLVAVWAFVFASSGALAKSSQILVVGDSISAGYGLSTGEGWVDLLTKKLGKEKIPAEVINASISGDTTAGGLSRLPALLAKHRPTHVVIELGGNDGLRGSPVATAKANLCSVTSSSKPASGCGPISGGRR